MSQQILRIARPTKIELIRLRRRLRIARRLHKVLKDRLIILTQELISLIREAIRLRDEVSKYTGKCYDLLIKTLLIYRFEDLEMFSNSRFARSEVVVGSRVVAGTRVPLIDVNKELRRLELSSFISSSLMDCGECFDKLLERIIRLAEVEESVIRLGNEVARVKRRVNALENILIPRIENTIKFLEMKFEEREREDKMRLKKVKEILERRRS